MKSAFYCVLTLSISLLSSDVLAQKSAVPEESREAAPSRQEEGARRGSRAGQRGGEKQEPASPTAVKLTDDVATLSPENTKVDFVGIHTGDDPKPRLGGFKKFTGKLTLADDAISSLTMDFETASLWTELGGDLTNHLKNKDFLDVETFPAAKFVSKSVAVGEEGKINVVGDFTLMGKTNEITIPVTVKKDEAGVLVKGDFKLDRASFGMNKMLDRVSKDVSITVSIGEKTIGGADAGGEGRGRGRGGRGFDPAAFFKQMDKDGDGKLAGDEIPDRMKERVDTLDTDKDGAISLKEMQSAMQGRGGGRGRGGNRQGGRDQN